MNFQPKLIEQDLKCRSQHPNPIQFVNLVQNMANDQRLICTACENNSGSNVNLCEYPLLQKTFYDQQVEKMKYYELIISPHIKIVNQFIETVTLLKTKIMQQLDYLLGFSHGWHQEIVDSITSYSFFDSLTNLISLKEITVDLTQLIDKTRKTHQDRKTKISFALDQFQIQPQFKICKSLINQLVELINKQEIELNSQLKDKLFVNQQFYELQERIRKIYKQSELIEDKIYYKYQSNYYHSQKKRFSILQTEDQIIYTSNDGTIIRNDLSIKQPLLLKKWEQILNLQWIGQYDQSQKKVGSWKATWKEETISGVGGQYIYGLKQGLWVEIISNYWSQAQAFEIGEYDSDKRIGTWKIKYQDNQIGGGDYNQLGFRFGKWIQPQECFWNYAQVTYNGEYNMNGMKIGRWNIMYRQFNQNEYNQIGGGSYDFEGAQKKIGKWIELDQGFWYFAQITYIGKYNMQGMKVGRWDTMYCKYDEKEYQQIGGGQYDEDGSQKKIGKWRELDEGFMFDKQVLHYGEYNMNGKKKGKWDIIFFQREEKESKQIGGGSYDLEGEQKKNGIWVELDEEFSCFSQITYNGEFNLQGNKVGKWDTMYCKQNEKEYKQIGGGSYDQEGREKKIGSWIELVDRFYHQRQVIFKGDYSINGIKVGRWDIMFCKLNEQEYKQIGGGSYDQDGNQKKIGKWVDLDYGFNCNKQVIYNGEYNIKGQKVGKWDIEYDNNQDGKYRLIGGGQYDQEGGQTKNGSWIDLDEEFQVEKQVIYKGEYKMKGIKVGRWDIMYDKWGNGEYQQIGGGSYDEEGNLKKIGNWTELGEEFYYCQQVFYKGEYNQKGIKIGTWIKRVSSGKKEHQQKFDY